MNAKQPKFCHFCGQKLVGSYLIYDNSLVVCERCDATVSRCSQCNLPSRQLTSVRNVLICPACRQKASLCPCCRQPILGKYFIIGDSPIRYCETCVATRPRCDICRAPLDEQGKSFPDKDGPVYRCASCLQSAVMNIGDAERLYRETAALLQQELQLNIPRLPLLHLVDRATLMSLNREVGLLAGPDIPLGAEHQHLLGFFQQSNEERTIFIQQLLPQMLFRAIAAHELAHAWQSFYAPPQQPLKVVEGFAEWVAYRLLMALGEQREAARLTRRSDLYGEGLQYFIGLERQYGRQEVLQQAKTFLPS